MTSVQCKIEVPAVKGLTDNEITVGRDFLLTCEGEFPRDLHLEKLHFVVKPEQKYSIHLRDFEFRSTTSADLKITSYKAGEFRFDSLQLTDGEQTLDLGSVAYSVRSVLEPPKAAPGEAVAKPEPYGPIGPLAISIPGLYWTVGAVALGLLVSGVGYRIFRLIQRRRTVARLKKHDSAQTPIAEFYGGLRHLQRYNKVFLGGEVGQEDVHSCVTELHRLLLLYVTRKYKIPALEWGPRLVGKELKKYHIKFYREFGDELQKLMKELYKAQQDQGSHKDALNLFKRTRKLVEGMERFT